MDTRLNELCLKAASYLDEGGDPFSIDFLCLHSITLDEAIAMANIFAQAVRDKLVS